MAGPWEFCDYYLQKFTSKIRLTNKHSKLYQKSRRHSSPLAYCHVSCDTLYMYICINVVFQKIRARLQSNMIGNTLQLYFSKKLINRDGYFGVIIYVIHGYPLWVQLVGFRANLNSVIMENQQSISFRPLCIFTSTFIHVIHDLFSFINYLNSKMIFQLNHIFSCLSGQPYLYVNQCI